MDFSRLKQTLGGLYLKNDPANRFDQAERLADKALAWADSTEDAVDRDLTRALAFCLAVREPVRSQMSVRSNVEACLVEQGWTPLRVRELVRALERLPDKPKSTEEKLVADADTFFSLGLVGLVRQVAMGAARGTSLEDCLQAAHKTLTRRVLTSAAQADCMAPRDELREALTKVKKGLERPRR